MKDLKNSILEEVAYYDAPINQLKLDLFAAQLSGVDLGALRKAMSHFRGQPGRRQMPMPSDLIDWIGQQQGGHPSVEIAWAMMPRDESDSVVWTDEMSEAFGCARPLLLEGDGIAARMAFKESYSRLVDQARDERRPAVWRPSFGHDPNGRVAALNDAIDKKRLTAAEAQKFLPHAEVRQSQIAIPGPETVQSAEAIAKIRTLISGSLPEPPGKSLPDKNAAPGLSSVGSFLPTMPKIPSDRSNSP